MGERTMIKLGDHLAVEWGGPQQAHHWNVGEHRLVKAWKNPEDETADWMCFDHGWDCWVTRLAANGAPFELDFIKDIDADPNPESRHEP